MLTRILADENFNEHILHALERHRTGLDIVRARDESVGLLNTEDLLIVLWATSHDRVLLTHDKRTISPLAARILREGGSFSGIFLIDQIVGIGPILDDLLSIIDTSDSEDWRDQVVWLPRPDQER